MLKYWDIEGYFLIKYWLADIICSRSINSIKLISFINAPVEAEEEEKEREHSMLQDQLDKEIQELDKRLEQKEVPNL